MSGPAMALDDAVALPAGVYTVVGETRYSAPGLTWYVWTLADDTGQESVLAQVDRDLCTPITEATEAVPEGEQIEINGVAYRLQGRGEARVQQVASGERDFWLAPFRYYRAQQRIAVFSLDKDGPHRLLGEVMDPHLVQVEASGTSSHGQ